MANNHQNPDHNGIVQALLDLQQQGFGTMTVSDLLTYSKSSEGKKILSDLGRRFDQRGYSTESIQYAQVGLDPQWMLLSGIELKILHLMGITASQGGYVSIRVGDIAEITGVSDKTVSRSLSSLLDCGALALIAEHRQRETDIYQVNPRMYHTGKRLTMSSKLGSFLSKSSHNEYLLNQPMPYDLDVELVTRELDDGSRIQYSRVTKKEPSQSPNEESSHTSTSLTESKYITVKPDPSSRRPAKKIRDTDTDGFDYFGTEIFDPCPEIPEVHHE